ncbi:SLIT-ROBO Rho GTPase-activating protein 1-like isoform X2 [Anastrepha ludens]|nr:SLIT-ROBO Rho GTPase-activating protein 1-like isoform X2 [Anastrepha ludens]XP_053963141.1 SLIT-ROBO Rho GTPase-activating protein 1-like isoform X2 [Anastrepha ludens]XP_053963142.1 SLIT-ROBO Rho GTPase-activating protein 1-like isoform X2 [Anastrepha ludens]XP_053963143.1 SLIT-ROBO Rho GTPase-activating protein 1-like isoform X2 [Anastrepha ludens]XP_053963144.1 SLIT-ROBO Rho GTPase-activating protein 1-like isoform X2 [Anastrepha ludens]XP_053963146.1 SLIT-ROBO Rho GTPase-activating pro
MMGEKDQDIKSPMKRVGSTRKIVMFSNIRQQLNEQLRCLDIRVESQVGLIQEIQDFFRRRGELELDYSKSLEKFARGLLLKHKEQKQKRDHWPIFSTFACWQHLVKETQSLSKDHAILADLYSISIVASLQTTIEDVQRIYKKCKLIGYEIHEDIQRLLQELHMTMKTYQRYESECKSAKIKLVTAEAQRKKLEQTIAKEKLERNKKYKLTEKEIIKRDTKYKDARLKALKAKTEYQLCLEASNTTIHKYFVEDLCDLIDCMDLGFGSMISKAILMHVSADQGRSRAILQQADNLSHLIHSIDCRADKQKFLEHHHAAFMIPKRLELQCQQDQSDSIEMEIKKELHLDMEQRLETLGQRLRDLRIECDEVWKSLETAETKLLEHYNSKDNDTSDIFTEGKQYLLKPPNCNITPKLKAEKQDIEDYYITKIREYITGTSRIARLSAKAEFLRNVLIKDNSCNLPSHAKGIVSVRKRIGRVNISGQPKLFGGSLEEYLEFTGEEVPLVMRSCIRVINLYGLHHQGIFRVSGSQVEISNFREAFERGEDPLADTNDASDINSVAGVLKLYLRELREPLFPIVYFEHFVAIAGIHTKEDIITAIRNFLSNLSPAVLVVIRYLFAFLNHLSEYADENMMDAFNLAICFGPTLMPAPEDKDQVQYQNQINELIKCMILYHDDIFPPDLVGLEYEKYISHEPFMDIFVGESPVDNVTEDLDSEICPSEDESETLEATVQFDFKARSNRELSIRKGDIVILRKQVSNDWWHGALNGREGLIPDKYISLRIKGEDRDKVCTEQYTSRNINTENESAVESRIDTAKEDCHIFIQSDIEPIPNSLRTNNEFYEDNSLNAYENNAELQIVHNCDNLENIPAQESKMHINSSETMLKDAEINDNSVTCKMHSVNDSGNNSQSSAELEHVSKAEDTTEEELKNLSEFQKNKFLWEVRSRGTSKEAFYNLPYEKKHIAPDLVMDLPISKNKTIFEYVSQVVDPEDTDETAHMKGNMASFKKAEHTTFTKKNNCNEDSKAASVSSPGPVKEDLPSQRDLFIVEGNNLYANVNVSSTSTGGYILERELKQYQMAHKQNDLKKNETIVNESTVETNKSDNIE